NPRPGVYFDPRREKSLKAFFFYRYVVSPNAQSLCTVEACRSSLHEAALCRRSVGNRHLGIGNYCPRGITDRSHDGPGCRDLPVDVWGAEAQETSHKKHGDPGSAGISSKHGASFLKRVTCENLACLTQDPTLKENSTLATLSI